MAPAAQTARALLRRGGINALASAADLLAPVRRSLASGLTIFAFHDVTPDPSPYEERFRLATDPALFARHIDWIRRRYEIVHPDLLLDDDPPLPARAAMLTFDDGWAGTFEHALPHLAALDLPAIVFVNMSTVEGLVDVAALIAFEIGDAPAHPPWPTPQSFGDTDLEQPVRPDHDAYQGRFATPDHLEAWDSSSLVRYGNHLHRHWDSSSLTAEQFAAEFTRNEASLRPYRATRPLFAFPFGQPDTHFRPEQVHQALALGARRVLTGLPIGNSPPYGPLLHRVSFTPNHVRASDLWYMTHHRRVRRTLRLGA